MAEGLRNRRRPRRTPGRVAAARRYAAWINSPAWRQRRRRWASEETRRSGRIVCAVCSQPWRERRDDLHHASYSRIGRERHEDLVPIAKGHRRLETVSIIARLKELKDKEKQQ